MAGTAMTRTEMPSGKSVRLPSSLPAQPNPPRANASPEKAADDEFDEITREISSLRRQFDTISKNIRKRKDANKTLTADRRLAGHYRLQVAENDKAIKKLEQDLAAAEQTLPEKLQKKEELKPRAQKLRAERRAKEKAAEDKIKAEERTKKIRDNHMKFEYKCTARPSSDSRRQLPLKSVSTQSASKPAYVSQSNKAPLKRKREENIDEEEADKDIEPKKAKVQNSFPSAVTAEQLSSLPRIPKKGKSPEEERTFVKKRKDSAQMVSRASATMRDSAVAGKVRGSAGNDANSAFSKKSESFRAYTKTTSQSSKRKRSIEDDIEEPEPVSKRANTAAGAAPKAMPSSTETPGAKKVACTSGRGNKSFATGVSTSRKANGSEDEEESLTQPPASSPEEDKGATKNNVKPSGILGAAFGSAFNATLQLLNAALTDEQVATMAGDTFPDNFGLGEADCAKYANSKSKARFRVAFEEKLTQARARIAKASDEKPVRLSEYVGRVLQKLRTKNDDDTNTLLAQTVFEKKADVTNADPATCMKKLLRILGEERNSLSDTFEPKHMETTKCSTADCGFAMNTDKSPMLMLETEAGEAKYRIIIDDGGEQMEEEIKLTIDDVVEDAISRSNDKTVQRTVCQRCETPGVLQTTKKVSAYPENLVISIKRSEDSSAVEVGLDTVRVAEQIYKIEGLVHESKLSETLFMGFQKVDGIWWKIVDEESEAVKDFQVQDSVRSHWVLALLRKM